MAAMMMGAVILAGIVVKHRNPDDPPRTLDPSWPTPEGHPDVIWTECVVPPVTVMQAFPAPLPYIGPTFRVHADSIVQLGRTYEGTLLGACHRLDLRRVTFGLLEAPLCEAGGPLEAWIVRPGAWPQPAPSEGG